MTIVRNCLAITCAVIAIALSTAMVRADDCDDIIDELKKLNERVMNDKADAKTAPAICAAIGQVLGIVKASRETAAECYEDGAKRDNILLTLDKATKEMETQINSACQ